MRMLKEVCENPGSVHGQVRGHVHAPYPALAVKEGETLGHALFARDLARDVGDQEAELALARHPFVHLLFEVAQAVQVVLHFLAGEQTTALFLATARIAAVAGATAARLAAVVSTTTGGLAAVVAATARRLAALTGSATGLALGEQATALLAAAGVAARIAAVVGATTSRLTAVVRATAAGFATA